MDPRDHIDLVRLDEAQRDALFQRLGRSNGPGRGDDRRIEPRWHHRRHDVRVTVEHPGGGESRFLILARNLSCNGMGFIHGGFVHNTTRCTVELASADGAVHTVRGAVVACRHLEGVLHEVGVRFDVPLEPTRFLSFDAGTDDEQDDASNATLPGISGRILYVEPSDIDANLMAFYLSRTEIAVSRASTVLQANDAMGTTAFDLVAIDVELGAENGVKAIESMRAEGFDGPFVVITAESREAVLSAAMWAGAEHVLAKPYRRAELYELLTQLNREHRAFASSGVLYSTVGTGSGLDDMLTQFINHAEATAQLIDQAMSRQSFDVVRSACLSIKGSAAGYGFAPLGAAALEALEMLDETMSVTQCIDPLRDLAGLCRRLAAYPSC